MDPDERVIDAIRLVFRKFRELGSARQVLLWAKQAGCVFRRSVTDRFGIVTAEFGNVTDHFGDVTD
jgi:hypothetical protein